MFQKWMKELIPRLAEPSVIVMDNAPVYSVLKMKRPSSQRRKGDMQHFLTQHNIPFRPEHNFRAPSHVATAVRFRAARLVAEHWFEWRPSHVQRTCAAAPSVAGLSLREAAEGVRVIASRTQL